MKIAVIGSRNFADKELLDSTLKGFLPQIEKLISGGAEGADKMAEQFAKENNIKTQIFIPEYLKYGRRAPLERNKLIIQASDFCIAFWDGESAGTRHAISCAKQLKRPTFIVYF